MNKIKTQVELVRGKSYVYPKSRTDYKALQALKTPVSKLGYDELPILLAFLKRKKISYVLHSFDDVEAKAMRKIRQFWTHKIESRDNRRKLIFTALKTEVDTALLQKLERSLHKFYENHFIKIEVKTKRTKTSHILMMTKVI